MLGAPGPRRQPSCDAGSQEPYAAQNPLVRIVRGQEQAGVPHQGASPSSGNPHRMLSQQPPHASQQPPHADPPWRGGAPPYGDGQRAQDQDNRAAVLACLESLYASGQASSGRPGGDGTPQPVLVVRDYGGGDGSAGGGGGTWPPQWQPAPLPPRAVMPQQQSLQHVLGAAQPQLSQPLQPHAAQAHAHAEQPHARTPPDNSHYVSRHAPYFQSLQPPPHKDSPHLAGQRSGEHRSGRTARDSDGGGNRHPVPGGRGSRDVWQGEVTKKRRRR